MSVANGLCVFSDVFYCYINTFLCLAYLNRRSNTTLISLVHRWAEVTGDDANELRKWMEYRTSLDSKDNVLISDNPIAITFVYMLVRHYSDIIPDMNELQEAYEEARYIIDSNRLSVSLFALSADN